MKTLLILVVAVVLGLGLPANTFAQETNAEAGVQAVLDSVTTAISACQIDTFATYWDEDATMYEPSGGPLQSKADFVDAWRQACAESEGFTLDEQEGEIIIYGDTALAISTATLTATGSDQNSPSGMNRFTTVLRKTANGWKIVHAHGSSLSPSENEEEE